MLCVHLINIATTLKEGRNILVCHTKLVNLATCAKLIQYMYVHIWASVGGGGGKGATPPRILFYVLDIFSLWGEGIFLDYLLPVQNVCGRLCVGLHVTNI